MPGMKVAACLLLIAIGWAGRPATAHEFWIDPWPFTPRQGAEVSLGLKVGKMLAGADYPFLSSGIASFTVTNREGTQKVDGIEGDIPAATFQADSAGLHIIAYHALPYPLTFATFPEFADYLNYEGIGAIAIAHRARGLPETGIRERYIRCAKALVQVGPADRLDADRSMGLPFELVAQANPYDPGLVVLPVVLTWKGKPVADRQVSIFRNDGQVTRSLAMTDALGQVLVPLAGGGQFLLNSVQMDPVEGSETMWESHWTSLTFGRPLR